LIVVFYNM